MRSPGRTSLAGLAVLALCVGAAPAPVPSAAPPPSASAAPTAAPSPAPAPSGSSFPAPSGPPVAAPSGSPGAAPSGSPGAVPRAPSPRPSSRSTSKPGASPAPSAAPKTSLETPFYKVETDEITYKGNGDFTMPHKVTFSRPGSDGTADRGEGNDKRGTVSLFGNVVLHDNGNAPEANSDDEYAKGGPSTLTCDQLDVDSKTKIYTAIGHVHFEQGARKADAQRGVLNRNTGMLRLEGNVKTVDGESSLAAENVDYNLNTKRVEANGKPIVMKQPVPTPEPGSATPSPKPKKRRIPLPI
ncbi:MAG: OstA-like protein [Candidatus Eremiobacteraeota bacterium]|nr:OstA-like protein [Candidatus Eremiobacteraeota bacterium]